MKKIRLPDVTLLAPTGNHIEETIAAMLKCCEGIDFGAVLLLTHEKPDGLPEPIVFERSWVPMDSYWGYNKYVFEDLFRHFNTSHCLVMQYDSWVINPELWRDEWLKYDYIGAPWAYRDDSYIAWGTKEHVRVGNGGFSLRSKKLTELPSNKRIYLTDERGYFNEDGNICCYYRPVFLEADIKYAPIEEARIFSFETIVPENYGIKTFGFHKHMPPWG